MKLTKKLMFAVVLALCVPVGTQGADKIITVEQTAQAKESDETKVATPKIEDEYNVTSVMSNESQIQSAIYIAPNTIQDTSENTQNEIQVTNTLYELKEVEQEHKDNENQNNTSILIKMYTTDNVHIRQFPDITSDILGTLHRNTEVEIISDSDEDWYEIKLENGTAYVKAEYLSSEPIKESYTENDLYILAHVLTGECQSYPWEEQLYVGSVVLNRVASNKYPNSIRAVVFQKGQYACTIDGNYYRTPTNTNWEAARWLLENGSVLPGQVVYQSRGKQGKGVYLATQYHKYCY